mgnify:CR=1
MVKKVDAKVIRSMEDLQTGPITENVVFIIRPTIKLILEAKRKGVKTIWIRKSRVVTASSSALDLAADIDIDVIEIKNEKSLVAKIVEIEVEE